MLEINFSFEYKLSSDLFVLYLNYKAMKSVWLQWWQYLLLDSFNLSLGTESRESQILSRNFQYLMHENLARDNHFLSKKLHLKWCLSLRYHRDINGGFQRYNWSPWRESIWIVSFAHTVSYRPFLTIFNSTVGFWPHVLNKPFLSKKFSHSFHSYRSLFLRVENKTLLSNEFYHNFLLYI
jgi:hypothetical protein